MHYSARNPEERVPLTPAVFHILLSLSDGERHGYSIMRDVSALTHGKLRLGPATLYRSIKHLVEDGLIEESDVRPDPALDDERRHYYRLTEFGRQVVVAEIKRLEETLLVARTRRGLRDLLPAPSIESSPSFRGKSQNASQRIELEGPGNRINSQSVSPERVESPIEEVQ